MILLILILILLFGLGPVYYGPRAGWSTPQTISPLVLILVLILILWALGVLPAAGPGLRLR